MAKFCGNCGKQFDDSAKVCGNCGTPLAGSPAKIPGIKFDASDKRKEARVKIKKKIKLCAAVAALVLAAVLAFIVIMPFTGYNGLLRKTMNAYKEYDIDALVSMSSDMYYYGSSDYADVYFRSTVDRALDTFESAVGYNYKLTYEVNETYKLSKRDFEAVLDDIEGIFAEFDTSIIEKILVADITVTAMQGEKSVDKVLKVIMSKEDGEWKLLYIE